MLNTTINDDCVNILPNIPNKSVDLILIDPPYLISKESNFKKINDNTKDSMIKKYGNITIDFGEWDKVEIDWEYLFKEYQRILKKGGSIIIFFDIWKIGYIKDIAERFGFKQPRVCKWEKNNPVPINSKQNYLSNATEYFITFVKMGKPTFNSEYDNGVYKYPLCSGRERYNHPTQKPLGLITEIILKHSKEDDVVLDTFAGTGTTAEACINTKRNFIIIEKDINYYNIIQERIDK